MNDKISSFFRNKLAKAGRRHSCLNLLLLLNFPVTLTLWLGLAHLLYVLSKGNTECARLVIHCLPHDDGWASVFVLSLFLPALLLSFVLVNLCLWLIPPVRKRLESEAKDHLGARYGAAQKALLKKIFLLCVPCVAVALFALHKM